MLKSFNVVKHEHHPGSRWERRQRAFEIEPIDDAENRSRLARTTRWFVAERFGRLIESGATTSQMIEAHVRSKPKQRSCLQRQGWRSKLSRNNSVSQSRRSRTRTSVRSFWQI